MWHENVRVKNDVIRRWFWAFENDSAAFRDTLHPEIEWFPIDENRGRLYGIEAALRNRNEWLETWGEHRFEVDEVAAEGDSFVVLVHITARGRISGAEVDVRFYAHAKLRDDKVVYIYDHEDRAAALEAAGLPEQAMSQENIDAILRGMDAFNDGNDEGYVSLAHPDIEWDTGLLGTPTYRGREGIRRMLRDVRAAWADLQADVVGTPTDMDAWVVWEVRLRGHGRTTGAPVEGSQFFTAKFREGLVECGGAFASKAEALEAAGLSE